MGRIEDLAERYEQHISTPWQRTVAGAQRVLMVVYEKELERVFRERTKAFENATRASGHDWFEVDLTQAFAAWLGNDEYRDSFFEAPEDLQLKLQDEFPEFVAARIRSLLKRDDVTENSVVALLGVGSLFGFTSVSDVIRRVEGDISGRLVVFFPGQYEDNKYRLLDASDGWNYLATPITLHGTWGSV
jgi:hypothetical protein